VQIDDSAEVGELGKAGVDFKIANRENLSPGFRLCRHCDKVQESPWKRQRKAFSLCTSAGMLPVTRSLAGS
jgi:hypothetical protein